MRPSRVAIYNSPRDNPKSKQAPAARFVQRPRERNFLNFPRVLSSLRLSSRRLTTDRSVTYTPAVSTFHSAMASQKALEFSFSASVINKVLKDSGVPENTSVSRDARSALGKSASIFVLYLTTHAKRLAEEDNRKTITPSDIVNATCNIGFEDFIPHLETTCEESKKLHEESKRKRAEKQKLKAQANPQSLLNHGPIGVHEENGDRSSPDPEVIEIDDDE